MHYDPKKGNHGLAHDPLTALVVPRPIGWISTIGPKGMVNLAPYSFFNAIGEEPPMLAFSSYGASWKSRDSMPRLTSERTALRPPRTPRSRKQASLSTASQVSNGGSRRRSVSRAQA